MDSDTRTNILNTKGIMMSTEMTPLMKTVVRMQETENKRKDLIPRILLMNCETRSLYRDQPIDDMWYLNSGARMNDIIRLVHNRQRPHLTQIALFAGHSFYLDYEGKKILDSYLLDEETRTWWHGDIFDDRGSLVAKKPEDDVLKLIRAIPHDLLMRPENLESRGVSLFNGGFLDYVEKCTCNYCKRYQRLFG